MTEEMILESMARRGELAAIKPKTIIDILHHEEPGLRTIVSIAILAVVHMRKEATAADMAKILKVSTSSCLKIANKLSAHGFLVKEGRGSTGSCGKIPNLYRLKMSAS